MNIPSIQSVQAMINKEFGNNTSIASGVKFQYTFDNGLMTRIDFDAPIKSHCTILTDIWRLFEFEFKGAILTDIWKLFEFEFKGDTYKGNSVYTVNKIFESAYTNETTYLFTFALETPEISSLLKKVIDKLNTIIKTNEGLATTTSAFLRGNYSIIADYIRNTCMVDLYGLINPSHLPTEGDISSYTPTKEEYEELDKVIRMYSFMFGEMFTLMLMPMNPSGLILRSRKGGMTETSTIDIELN